MKKKTIAIFVSSAVLMVAVFSFASAATNGQPFNALQDSLNKLQAQIDKLNANSNTGGVQRIVKTGIIPSSIPGTLGEDDKVIDTEEVIGQGGTTQDITYHSRTCYKKVIIPEIDTNDMPQVSLYLKTTEERFADLGETWIPSSGDIVFIQDGAVYLRYATDHTGGPYGFGIDVYPEMGGKYYKIVVIN